MELVHWHPIMVHFTVALLAMSVLFYLSGSVIRHPAWRERCFKAAELNLWVGTFLTLFTAGFGFIAFNIVTHDDAAHGNMLIHRNWALITVVLFVLSAIWSFVKRRRIEGPSKLFLLLLIIAGAALGLTGYYGGKLVYEHGLAVRSLPETKGAGHHHTDEPHEHSH